MVEFIDRESLASRLSASGVQSESVPNTDHDSYASESVGYPVQQHPLQYGLVGWWPLSWNSARDLSGNDNHGTLNGDVTTGVAVRGGLQAMGFDGDSAYIDLGTAPPAQDAYAVSFWIKPEDNSSRQRVIDSVGDYAIMFGDSGNDIDIVTYDDNSIGRFSDHALTLGEWHYVYVHYISGSEYAVSVNGQTLETVSSSDGSIDGEGAWAIGTDADSPGSANFEGVLCDFRIYNRALSASEIQFLYELGSVDVARPPTDGVARYALDGDATDSWGSNDGTNNGVTFVNGAIRGQAGEFAGGDYIDISGAFPDSSFTFSTWFKADSLESGDFGHLYHVDESGSWGQVFLSVTGGDSIRFAVADGSQIVEAVPSGYSTGVWYHVAAVCEENDSIRVYVNGRLAEETSFGTLGPTASQQELGGNAADNANYYVGLMDDPRIYPYALSPGEVFQNYLWGTRGIDMTQHTVKA